MKKTFILFGLATMLCLAAQAQVIKPVVLPPGKIAVFKAGTSDTNWPMATARCAPCFVQVFDPATLNQSSTNPVVSVAMSTNVNVPGSVWINHHAGSEGGALSRSVDRQFLALEGYTGTILTPTNAKPSTDFTVTRGIVTMDAFTNPISVYSSANWFGVPPGSATGTQDNPTGIATTDGTNFWGTGNFAGTSTELDGTLFYDGSSVDAGNGVPGAGTPVEVQNYMQAAGEARIVGGTLYVAAKAATGVASGIYNFVDPASGNVVPRPYDPNVPMPYQAPTFTNLFINWGSTFKTILNFDMDAAHTVAYGADQTYGIVKFTNNAGTWVQAPYYFSSTNLNTRAQTSANQGCFGICVDFSGANPVIYATTMENGTTNTITGGLGVNTAQSHQNNNRLIKIVDTGVAPGTAVVAQTLAIAATTNEFFGGIDFTPDLRPLIVSQTGDYATIVAGSGSFFNVAVQSVYALTYQWYENGSPMNPITFPTATTSNLDLTVLASITGYNANGFTNLYQCVATNNYGAVTSAMAKLIVTVNPTPPIITSGTNHLAGYVNNSITFPAVSASGTQPFTTYQWYNQSGAKITDDGMKYVGSLTPSLSISNLVTPGDVGNYSLVISNSAGYASNVVDVLAVNYHKATISAGQPASVTTFVGTPTTLTADQSGATAPVTYQWYKGTTMLANGEYGNTSGTYAGPGSSALTINATTTSDTAINYYIVYSNGGGSVTSSLASVTVIVPPAHSSISYSNQIYTQNFDSLPDPGGASVNSINNPMDNGTINGVAYSLANPFDFAYPVLNNSYLGGLNLGTTMSGWYGSADTLYTGVDGITRFGAQNGDQSTGGVIDFGPNDVNGGALGINRALGLLSTSTTGPTSFAMKLVNNSANTLNYVNLSFLGELWRNNTGARTISFGYALDNANTFVLGSASISNSTLVPNLNISFPPALVLTVVDGTQPANQVPLATNNMVLSTPWAPGAALWLIWSIDYYGTGAGNGYAIDNLNFSASVAPITAPTLGVVSYSGGATGTGLKLNFTDSAYASPQFTVWGTTNLALPFAQWSNLGHPAEVTPGTGNYQFTDAQATNKPTRFYKVTSP